MKEIPTSKDNVAPLESRASGEKQLPSSEKIKSFIYGYDDGEFGVKIRDEEKLQRDYPQLSVLADNGLSEVAYRWRNALSMNMNPVRRDAESFESEAQRGSKDLGLLQLNLLYNFIKVDADARRQAFESSEGLLKEKNIFDPKMIDLSSQFIKSFEDFSELVSQRSEFKKELEEKEKQRKALGRKHQEISDNKHIASDEKRSQLAETQKEMQELKKNIEFLKWKAGLAENAMHLVHGYDQTFQKWKKGKSESDEVLRDQFEKEKLPGLLEKIFPKLVRRAERQGMTFQNLEAAQEVTKE